MNNKTKAITGISVITIALIGFKIWHTAHAVSGLVEGEKANSFENAPVYIISKDSTGKTDTTIWENPDKKKK